MDQFTSDGMVLNRYPKGQVMCVGKHTCTLSTLIVRGLQVMFFLTLLSFARCCWHYVAHAHEIMICPLLV